MRRSGAGRLRSVYVRSRDDETYYLVAVLARRGGKGALTLFEMEMEMGRRARFSTTSSMSRNRRRGRRRGRQGGRAGGDEGRRKIYYSYAQASLRLWGPEGDCRLPCLVAGKRRLWTAAGWSSSSLLRPSAGPVKASISHANYHGVDELLQERHGEDARERHRPPRHERFEGVDTRVHQPRP